MRLERTPQTLYNENMRLKVKRTRALEFSMFTLTAVVRKEEDMYVAKCPEVGTASQGNTIEEAVANLKEATELYLEEFPLEHVSRPVFTTFEVAGNVRA